MHDKIFNVTSNQENTQWNNSKMFICTKYITRWWKRGIVLVKVFLRSSPFIKFNVDVRVKLVQYFKILGRIGGSENKWWWEDSQGLETTEEMCWEGPERKRWDNRDKMET